LWSGVSHFEGQEVSWRRFAGKGNDCSNHGEAGDFPIALLKDGRIVELPWRHETGGQPVTNRIRRFQVGRLISLSKLKRSSKFASATFEAKIGPA